mmetsp:Transcript_27055/g.65760  ORF Transcript_27055/g.65760 Transcript_27055/m.65760 type:complete len:213 (-) Transcript_27055:1464-2102(-)
MDGFLTSVSTMVDKVRGTPLERKVREATSNEPWGCTGEVKEEIARATFNYQQYKEVMGTLWKRMEMPAKNWRGIFKALALLEYLLKAGSQRVTEEARERMHRIRTLEHFTYDDEDGSDKGSGVRTKAQQMIKLLRSEKALHKMRETYKKNKSKFSGVSSEGGSAVRYGGYGGSSGGGGGGNRYGGYGGNDDEEDYGRKKKKKTKKEEKEEVR